MLIKIQVFPLKLAGLYGLYVLCIMVFFYCELLSHLGLIIFLSSLKVNHYEKGSDLLASIIQSLLQPMAQ